MGGTRAGVSRPARMTAIPPKGNGIDAGRNVVVHAWLRWLGSVMARVADRSQPRDVTAMGT